MTIRFRIDLSAVLGHLLRSIPRRLSRSSFRLLLVLMLATDQPFESNQAQKQKRGSHVLCPMHLTALK